MCGICGIIDLNKEPVPHEVIKNMNDLVIHRGPDDEGYFHGQYFAFGHRRLSILDLSEAGHQPMKFLDKYVLAYNGEIYNYVEIKEKLVRCGYKFSTGSDTEVILAAYDKWGNDCVKKFNGMWAFALYDKEKNIVFCSRDRFGIKPFYYTITDDKFIFGSEIKQLLIFYDERFVNKKILVDYIVRGVEEHSYETFFKNIYKLKPSHNLIYSLNTNIFDIKRYYHIRINDSISDFDEEAAISLYKNELLKSVKIRLRSDVKVGTCLSGGTDSSCLAVMASSLYRTRSKEKFNAITAKSIDKKLDESEFARLVVERVDLAWNCVEPNTEDFKKTIEEVVVTQEEPFGSTSVFMQYFIMKKAREIGCIVMLDGQGGDETLLGYEKYFPAAYFEFYRKIGLSKTIVEIWKSHKNNAKMSLKRILISTIGFFFSGLRKIKFHKECSFLKKEYLNSNGFPDQISVKNSNIHKLQITEIENTNLPALLRYEDKNSMKHSIETRLPYIDYKTLEIALSINLNHKIKNGWTKYILRMAMNGEIPDEVIWRKNKFAFDSPEDIWLNAHQIEMLNSTRNSKILSVITNIDILTQKYGKLNKRLQWRLYNIATWERLFDVRIN